MPVEQSYRWDPATQVPGVPKSAIAGVEAALWSETLDEIAQDMQRQDVDRLLANRQFLEERFGRASA